MKLQELWQCLKQPPLLFQITSVTHSPFYKLELSKLLLYFLFIKWKLITGRRKSKNHGPPLEILPFHLALWHTVTTVTQDHYCSITASKCSSQNSCNSTQLMNVIHATQCNKTACSGVRTHISKRPCLLLSFQAILFPPLHFPVCCCINEDSRGVRQVKQRSLVHISEGAATRKPLHCGTDPIQEEQCCCAFFLLRHQRNCF